MRLIGHIGIVVLLLACTPSFAAPSKKRDRSAHLDSLRDSSGATLYHIHCTDIDVRLRSGSWLPTDSVLFFTERTKVEWASTALRNQEQHLQDSLQHLTDSAGAWIGSHRFTKERFDSTIVAVQASLEKIVNTHNYSLRRLEDYQAVLNAARPILGPSHR